MAQFRLPFQRPRNEDEHRRNGETIQVWAQRRYVQLRHSANYNRAAGWQTLFFDTVVEADVAGDWSTTTHKYTCPMDGLYLCQLTVLTVNIAPINNPQRTYLGIWRNGTYVYWGNDITIRGTVANDNLGLIASQVIPMRRNDTIDFAVNNSGPTGITIDAGNDIARTTFATIQRIGPHPQDLYR